MSALLDEIIAMRKAKALEYAEYLQQIAELVKRTVAGHGDNTPDPLKNNPAIRALYNNLKSTVPLDGKAAGGGENPNAGPVKGVSDAALDFAVRIDQRVRAERPDAWRGIQAREQVVKKAIFDVLQNEAETERIFLIVKAQRDY